ncbi:MAG: hypothetical protein QXW19_01635 [Candidatus Bathyarchaeia archaeon]
MGEAYRDEEIEQILHPKRKGLRALIDELEDEAESMPLIAMVAFFALGLGLGLATSRK